MMDVGPLSSADAAWLHMDEPGNLMVINGLLRLTERADLGQLRQRLAQSFSQHDRFNYQAVDPAWGGPRWQSSGQALDLSYHVVHTQVENETQLLQLVGQLMAQPLDRSRPLWQVHIVDLPDTTAIIIRLHHALGDGVAMMHVLSTLTDAPMETYQVPHLRALPSVFRQARAVGRAVFDLVTQVLLRSEPATPLKGPLSLPKRAAVSRSLPLASVKSIEKLVGCTVNDVLLACLAGGLRDYLGRRSYPLKPGLKLRVVMPVDLRSPGDDWLGNRFGLAFVSLPVGQADPRQRLLEIQEHVAHLKRTPHAQVIYAILKLAGWLPRKWELALVRLFGSRATAVATNVPGPKNRLAIVGHPVGDLMFWVPRSGRLGLGISIISYAGEVRVGIASDPGLIEDPQDLVDSFHKSFEELEGLLKPN
jgi:hypothetical protein